MSTSEKRRLPATRNPGRGRKQRKLQTVQPSRVGSALISTQKSPPKEGALQIGFAPTPTARDESERGSDVAGPSNRVEESNCSDGDIRDLPDNTNPNGFSGANSLESILYDTERRMRQHVSLAFNKLLTRIDDSETSLKEIQRTTGELKSGLADVKLLTLQGSASAARSQSKNNKVKKGPNLKDEVEIKHPTVSHEMGVAFSPNILCRACAHSTVSFLEVCHGKQDDVRMTSRTLSVLMYGLSSSSCKSEFKVGVGKMHADFRFKVANSCVDHARMLSDDAFRYKEKLLMADVAARKGSCLEGGDAMINSFSKPAWLAPGFLSKKIMLISRKFHECVKVERPAVPNHPDQRLAFHVGRTVVSTVNDMLRRSRYSARRKIFDAGLFLLVQWKDFKSFKPGVHREPTVRFLWDDEQPIEASQIPECYSSTDDAKWDHLASSVEEREIARESDL